MKEREVQITIEKWDPWQEPARLQQEANELFSNVFNRFSSTNGIIFNTADKCNFA